MSPAYVHSFMPACLRPLTCARIFSFSFAQITSPVLFSYAMVVDLALTTSFAFVTITCPTSSSFATAVTTAGGVRRSQMARGTSAWSGYRRHVRAGAEGPPGVATMRPCGRGARSSPTPGKIPNHFTSSRLRLAACHGRVCFV